MEIQTNVVPSLKSEKAEIQGGDLNYMELAYATQSGKSTAG